MSAFNCKAASFCQQMFTKDCRHTLAGQNIANRELWRQTSQEPVLTQLRRRKWNWLGHTLRSNDDSIAKQALPWTPQGHRNIGRLKNTWKRDLEKEIWTACFRYSWRKMETAAQDRAGWRQIVCGLCYSGSDKA